MEQPHNSDLRLFSIGPASFLEHRVTGEITRLLESESYELALDAAAFGSLLATAVHADPDGHRKQRRVYARQFLKMSLHKSVSGKLFIRHHDGSTTWLDVFSGQRSSTAFYMQQQGGGQVGFKVWHFSSSVAGSFLYWDLPYFVHAFGGTYTYDRLKVKVAACHTLLAKSGLAETHCFHCAFASCVRVCFI
jgi:hypothetical protein